MRNDPYLDYFQHLQGRSRLGWIYRNLYLYPRLRRHLTGHTLDIGCGIGDFLRYYGDAVGLDVNPHTIRYCQQRDLEARLIDGDRYPFDDQSFESAILDNVLEHLNDPAPTLQEIHRVLRPGGRLVIGVPGHKGYAADPDHKRFYGEQELDETVSHAGFAMDRLLHMPVRSSWLDRHASQYCIYGIFSRLPDEFK